LSREAEERGDALVVGLCNVVRKLWPHSTWCDVLPAISRYSACAHAQQG
jgi:hypothetical protein